VLVPPWRLVSIGVYFWCCSVRHTDRFLGEAPGRRAENLDKSTQPISTPVSIARSLRRVAVRPRPLRVLSMIRRPGLRAGSHAGNVIQRCLSTATPRTVKSLLFSPSPPAEGDVCSVNGWVRSVRTQKHVAFVALGDGTTLKPLQVVLQPDQADG
jgi:hypothetical protein